MFLCVCECFLTHLDGWRIATVCLECAHCKSSLFFRRMVGLHQNSCVFWGNVCGDETSIHIPPLAFMTGLCWGSRVPWAGRQSSSNARRGSSSVTAALSRLPVRVLNISSGCCPAASPSTSLLRSQVPWYQKGGGTAWRCSPWGRGAVLSTWEWRWWLVKMMLVDQTINPRLCTHSSCGFISSWDPGNSAPCILPHDCLCPLTAFDPCDVPTGLSNCEGRSYPF